MLARIVNQLIQIKPTQIRLSKLACFLCDWPLQVKTHNDEMGVRCTRCGASAVAQSLGRVFKEQTLNKPPIHVYELSSTGAFVRFLKNTQHHITLSELFDDTKHGEFKGGVMCQDVQQLTFADHSFDLCTSLEVFEHVEDDNKGFNEIFRVLKPGGKIMFTVPLDLNNKTIERTQVIDGHRVQTEPAEYHSDKLRGSGKVFCYRNYGYDILQKLETAGFVDCKIIHAEAGNLFGFGRPVIFGKKSHFSD